MKLKNLAKLRRFRGLTQTDLADLIGVTPGSIAHWEGGRGVTAQNLGKLCAAFHVSSDYLLGLPGAALDKPAPPLLRRVA